MGPSKIKVEFHACSQSFTICETLKTQVKLNLNFTRTWPEIPDIIYSNSTKILITYHFEIWL